MPLCVSRYCLGRIWTGAAITQSSVLRFVPLVHGSCSFFAPCSHTKLDYLLPALLLTVAPCLETRLWGVLYRYQQSSYVALQERIDLYFPPVNRGSLAQTGLDQASKSEPPPPKKFSDVAYWNPAKVRRLEPISVLSMAVILASP